MSAIIQKADLYGSLSVSELEAFEEMLGVQLPEEYRAFLQQTNGGVPEPNAFFVEGEDGRFETLVACFFALHHRDWDDSTPEGVLGFPLQEALKDFRRDLPDNRDMLPIGADVSGSYVCLCYMGAKRGQILFYDHDYEALYPLAASLRAFLDSLQPYSELPAEE